MFIVSIRGFVFFISYFCVMKKHKCRKIDIIKKYQIVFRQKILIILLLFFCKVCFAQNYIIPHALDSITEIYRIKGDIKGIIKLNKEALVQYKKVMNKRGVVVAYINIANYLSVLDNYKGSLDYLEKAEKELGHDNDPELRSRLCSGYGRNYASLNLYNDSNLELDKAITLAKKIIDKKIRDRRLYLGYSWKLYNFQQMEISDSIKFYEKKSLAISTDSYIYNSIIRRFLEEDKNLDSAGYYLIKASAIINTSSTYAHGLTLFNYGRWYGEKREYKKALDYYLEALKLFEKTQDKSARRDTYRLISETYHTMNEITKEVEYNYKYKLINDSIIREEKHALQIPLRKAVQKKEKWLNEEHTKLYILFSLFILILFVATFFLWRINKKKQGKIENLFIEKSLEVENLNTKLDSAFTEVLILAKQNDPSFLARFIEVHSDFYTKLTKVFPDLNPNEIKFCALLKLNFTSKDIANFENVSVRTAENRKYRIRKKLNLSSNINLNKWMMDL